MKRRSFLQASAATAAMLVTTRGLRAAEASPSGGRKPVLMHVGHQHDHSASTLRRLAAFGVEHICSGKISPRMDDNWSVDGLVRLRRHVESFGMHLDCIPLPMSSAEISRAEYPEILLAKDEGRDRAIEDIRQMIRNAGQAGIPMVKYNLTFIGVVRSASTAGRGDAVYSTFDHAAAKEDPPLTEAGRITADIYWDRIKYFLERVVPVAEEARVRIACHPQDPAMPPGRGWRGVETVLGTPDGLERFLNTVPSPYHGLNFCQGTVAEMLQKPGEEIYDVIRRFGSTGRIFNVHFRNIAGGYLNFRETFPDNGDVDMLRALRIYRDVGYAGMIMPDHVPQIEGDVGKHQAFSYVFGYIQALLQTLRAEA